MSERGWIGAGKVWLGTLGRDNVCLFMREKEREREREGVRETEKKRMCVCER